MNEFFWPFMSEVLIAVFLKGTAVLGLSLILFKVIRGGSAATKSHLLLLGLLGFALVPFVSASVPSWPLLPAWSSTSQGRLLSDLQDEEVLRSDRQRTQPEAFSLTLTQPKSPPLIPQSSFDESSLNEASLDESSSDEGASPVFSKSLESPSISSNRPDKLPIVETSGTDVDWEKLLLGIWALGLMVFGSRLGLGLIRLRVIEGFSKTVTDPIMQSRVDRLTRELGIERRVRVLRSSHQGSPMTWGLFVSRIWLPRDSQNWSESRERSVLTHELAHVKRGDWWRLVIAQGVRALYWFHPLVWWTVQTLRHESEAACDDVVLRSGTRPSRYAEQLLRIASQDSSGSPGSSIALAMTRRSKLELRLRLILDETRNRELLGTKTKWSLSLLLVATMIPLTLLAAEVHGLEDLQGIVQDGQGCALSRVEVSLIEFNEGQYPSLRLLEQTRSNAEGKFAFTRELVFDRGPFGRTKHQYYVTAKHGSLALEWKVLEEGPDSGLTFSLKEQGKTQDFRVLDPKGEPIEGARVILRNLGRDRSDVTEGRGKVQFSESVALIESLSGKDGRVTLTCLPDCLRGFRVSAEGYADAPVLPKSGFDDCIAVTLHQEASLEGQVFAADGAPLSEATVKLSADWMWLPLKTLTDEKGYYRFEKLEGKGASWTRDGGNGKYHLSVLHDEAVSLPRAIELTPGQDLSQDIHCERGTRLKVLVLEKGTKKVVPGAIVHVHYGAQRVERTTEEDGSFDVRLPRGVVSASLSCPAPDSYYLRERGAPRPSQRLDLSGDEAEVQLVTPSRLRALRRVRGKICYPDGRPAAGLHMELMDEVPVDRGREFRSWVRTDEQGQFEFEGGASGRVSFLHARTQDRSHALARMLEMGSEDLDLGTWELEVTVPAEVLLKDGAGNARANLSLSVTPTLGSAQFWPSQQWLKTDEQGRLQLPRSLPGQVYLLQEMETRSDGAMMVKNEYRIEVAESGESETKVLSDQISSRVIDRDGRRVQLVKIQSVYIYSGKARWILAGTSEVEPSEDRSFSLDRRSLSPVTPGTEVFIEFVPAGALPMVAKGIFPASSDQRLDFMTDEPMQRLDFDTSIGPEEVTADEIAGWVLNREGKPIEGATILTQGSITQHARTDGQGEFRIPDTGFVRYLQIEAAGYAPKWLRDFPTGEGFAVRLNDSTRVEAMFVDQNGQEVGDVDVTLIYQKKTLREGYADIEIPRSLKSQDDGSLEALVEPGEYEIKVKAPGGLFARYPSVWIESGTTFEIPPGLESGVDFQVKLIDSVTKEPVVGESLWVEGEGFGRGPMRTSDERGIAVFPSLMPGQTRVMISPETYARCWSEQSLWGHNGKSRPSLGQGIGRLPFELVRGMKTVEVTLEKGVVVKGRVTDPHGVALVGCRMHLGWTGRGTTFTGDSRFSQQTGLDGTYRMVLPAGNGVLYNIVAHDPQANWANGVSEPFHSKAGDELTKDLVLAQGGSAHGRVIDKNGQPIRGIGVRSQLVDGRGNIYADRETTTDAQGEFVLKALRPGACKVFVAEAWGAKYELLPDSSRAKVVIKSGDLTQVGALTHEPEGDK